MSLMLEEKNVRHKISELLNRTNLRILVGKMLSKRHENSLLYINGADTLPPPLTNEEENKILSQLEEHPEMRKILVERNLRLVVFIAKKFENTGTGLEDLISIGTIGLIKATNTFKAEKNIKLATYASRCIENEILMYIRKNGNTRQELSIDEPLNVDWDGNELLLSDILGSENDTVSQNIECDEEKAMVYAALRKLSKREQKIVDLRFGITSGEEMTQKEVADLLGISQSYISRLEKKIIANLKKDIGSRL